MAKECYSASIKQKAVDNIYVDELNMRDEVNTQPEPSEDLVSRIDSTSDPIGGSEPSSRCETIYWDSLPNFFFFKS